MSAQAGGGGTIRALGRVLAPLAFLALVAVALDALAVAGPPWVLLPVLPAGYGLARLIHAAVVR